MFKQLFISVLIIVFGVFGLFKAHEFYKIKKDEAEREKERVAFCSANEAEYKKCGIDEKGKEITPYRVVCKKQADEMTELNIKKIERQMVILENKYNICQSEVRELMPFDFRVDNEDPFGVKRDRKIHSQRAKCEEISAEYNNLKDERKILIKERKVSQEYVKNHKNQCSFDLERYRRHCLGMGLYSLSKAGYGWGEKPCFGMYMDDEMTYYEPN